MVKDVLSSPPKFGETVRIARVAEEARTGAVGGEHEGPPVESAERVTQAVIWGLRRQRDEAQLTQVIAEVARADRRFAGAFVELLLDTAAKGSQPENVRRLSDSGVPQELGCRAEAHLRDTGDASLGRVDLRFDGVDDFTLFVENKLYSGYGHEQVNRYLAALDGLPPERRSGLVSVTRNVPTYGEPRLEADNRWLGSVRWAHLRDRLAGLPIGDVQLRAQWRLFVDVLDQQGDLGMTRAQPELIRAWAQYLQGRKHLEDILDQVQERALDVVERAMRKKYGRKAKGEPLVAPYTRGKKRQVVQRDQVSVYLGFCIPAKVRDAALVIQFNGYYGVPHFTVQANPWDARELLDGGDRKLVKAAKLLENARYQSNGHYWAKVHDPSEYIDATDVPARLMEIIEEDVATLVASGVLDHDVEATLAKKRGGPPRDRKARADA
jgi:hypothetical protein